MTSPRPTSMAATRLATVAIVLLLVGVAIGAPQDRGTSPPSRPTSAAGAGGRAAPGATTDVRGNPAHLEHEPTAPVVPAAASAAVDRSVPASAGETPAVGRGSRDRIDRAAGSNGRDGRRRRASTAPPPPPPEEGAHLGRLRIPAIGLDHSIVEGITEAALRAGAGHFPSTALPGQGGNAALAGHRTTHGAPFGRIHEIRPGDLVHVRTPAGRTTYEVLGHGADGTSGHFIVQPDDVWILDDTGHDTLTLTSCHPIGSTAQRIVVVARRRSTPGA